MSIAVDVDSFNARIESFVSTFDTLPELKHFHLAHQ